MIAFVLSGAKLTHLFYVMKMHAFRFFFFPPATFSLSYMKTKMLVAVTHPAPGCMWVTILQTEREDSIWCLYLWQLHPHLVSDPGPRGKASSSSQMALRIGKPSRGCSEMWRSRFQVVWAQAKSFLCPLAGLQLLGRTSGCEIFPSVLAPPGGLVIAVLNWASSWVFTSRTADALGFFWAAAWRCQCSPDLLVCVGIWILFLQSHAQDFSE